MRNKCDWHSERSCGVNEAQLWSQTVHIQKTTQQQDR